eukprot:UN03759
MFKYFYICDQFYFIILEFIYVSCILCILILSVSGIPNI